MIRSTKIFLISADDSLSQPVCNCLTSSGYQVIHISHGVGAIATIRAEKPALLVLDAALPDFNSLAIVRSIRSDGLNHRMPIFLIGSNMKEEDVLIGLEAGADLCLVERFHPQVFIARVRSILRRCELAKDH